MQIAEARNPTLKRAAAGATPSADADAPSKRPRAEAAAATDDPAGGPLDTDDEELLLGFFASDDELN